MLAGPGRNLGARAQVELIEDVLDVRTHRRRADDELGSDLLVGQAQRQEARHVLLAPAELARR